MTAVAPRRVVSRPYPVQRAPLPPDRRVPVQHHFHHRCIRLGASTLPFLWNVIRSWRYGEITTADDPWGYGNSLEWATSSPPPRHNFTSLPRIRSERPAFELHHPNMIDRMRTEAHPARGWTPLDEAEANTRPNSVRTRNAPATNGD